MGTAREFSKILQKEVSFHAAWLPVTNTFRLGDYGVVSDGVFRQMGNIDEFGLEFREAPGPASKLDFKSQGVKVRRLVGSGEVNSLPDTDVEASIKIEFPKAHMFLLKAEISLDAMQNINQVAIQLAAEAGWQRKFRVVSSVYTGHDCVLMSSSSAGSVIEFNGTANALKQIEMGKVETRLEFSSNRDLGLEIAGETGVVGLRFFKVGRRGPKVMSLRDAKPEDITVIEQDISEIPDDDV